MADVASAFDAQIRSLGYGEAPERRLTTAEVSQLAAERAGTTNKSSRAYRSARRSIERRRTTARQSRGQINRQFAARVRRQGLNVEAVMEMDVSPDPDEEPDMRPRTIRIRLSGHALERMATALDRSDLAAAERAFLETLLRAYEQQSSDPSFTSSSFLAGADIGEVSALNISFGGQ